MKINQLIANNIHRLDAHLPVDKSLGIAGLSRSGKTTFFQAIGDESKKRLVSLLLKSEYQYLFPAIVETNFSAIKIEDMPLVLFLGKSSISSNPRSTIGTHTGIFKDIHVFLAEKFSLSPEVFSFNNALGWYPSCKGRGINKKSKTQLISVPIGRFPRAWPQPLRSVQGLRLVLFPLESPISTTIN